MSAAKKYRDRNNTSENKEILQPDFLPFIDRPGGAEDVSEVNELLDQFDYDIDEISYEAFLSTLPNPDSRG